MTIRIEQTGDEQQIQQLVTDAFESDAEARLVNALRASDGEFVSLVATGNNKIVGHILFTTVKLDGDSHLNLLGLAPLAVSTESQGTGIGSELVNAGLLTCKKLGTDAVMVLGAPEYYGRFGFTPASSFGISSVYEVEKQYFMLLELKTDSLDGKSGTVRYHDAFAGV